MSERGREGGWRDRLTGDTERWTGELADDTGKVSEEGGWRKERMEGRLNDRQNGRRKRKLSPPPAAATTARCAQLSTARELFGHGKSEKCNDVISQRSRPGRTPLGRHCMAATSLPAESSPGHCVLGRENAAYVHNAERCIHLQATLVYAKALHSRCC